MYNKHLQFAIQKTWESMGLVPPTNHYVLYLKSRCEAPDYEAECDAENREQASQIFAERTKMSSEFLLEHIQKA